MECPSRAHPGTVQPSEAPQPIGRGPCAAGLSSSELPGARGYAGSLGREGLGSHAISPGLPSKILELSRAHPTPTPQGLSFPVTMGQEGRDGRIEWRSKFPETPRRERDLGRGKGKSLGQGALRKVLEPHLCSSEQVTRVESLSPELRGQLQALLLQRPQHLIQPTGTRPCQGERPIPGPRTKSPG